MHIKPEIRILGIDDSALIHESVVIIGAFFRGGEQLDGIMSSAITKDGMDATDAIMSMVLGSKHYGQIKVIMLDGITFGGFNPVDINRIFEKTSIPVIVCMRSCPGLEKIQLALENLPEKEKRWDIIKKAGKIYKTNTASPVYFQVSGIEKDTAIEIIRMSSTHSNIPEPLRVAHLVATGVVLGESTGKA